MHTSSPWIRRGIVLAVVVALVAVVARRSRGGGTGGGLFPPIGGDTWPPVPVKDLRPT